MWRWQWDLVGGGLDPDTRTRHALPQSLEAWDGASTVFREDFEGHRPGQPDNWEPVGFPDVRLLTDAEPEGAGRFVTLAGVPEAEPAGIAWELPASLLAGQTVLCQVKTRLINAWAARRLGIPRVEFLVESHDGTLRSIGWPIIDWSSPGWDVQEFIWSAPIDLSRVQLRLVHEEAVASVGFDDFVLTVVDPDAGIGLPAVSRVGDNILPGGDFEVGVKGFAVTEAESSRPSEWYFDADAALGTRALFIPLHAEPVRVIFGPVVFTRTDDYVFSFQAKGSEGLRWTVSLAGLSPPAGGTSDAGPAHAGPITRAWHRYEGVFRVPPRMFGRTGFVELLVHPPDQPPQRRGLWLDAVALTRGRSAEAYAAPNECELGIVDRWDNPLDLARVLHLDQRPSFTIRAVNYADYPWSCMLAIDITDGLDRVVESQVAPVRLPARGVHNHPLKPRLPAGYYRILATLWPGPIGQGQPLSQAERSFALCDLLDPVPRGTPCGMNVVGQFCSRRLTQLGVGWVRWQPDLRSGGSAEDFLFLCREQALEVLLAGGHQGIETPGPQTTPTLMGREMAGSPQISAGGPTSTAPNGPDARWDRAVVEGDPLLVSPSWDVGGLKGKAPSGESLGRAVVFREEVVPESMEPVLPLLHRAVADGKLPQLWDLAMPVRVTGNYLLERHSVIAAPVGGGIVSRSDDAAWATSLTVRRFVLRLWAGVHRVALRPEAMRGGVVLPLLAEYDHSPTPLVPALDFMNKLLGTAHPLAWFNYGEVYILCFARPGGTTVGVVWRPFGRRPTWVPVSGMAGLVDVRNVFGSPEMVRVEGRDLFAPASQYVSYLICPEKHQAALLNALDALGRATPSDAPKSTPAREDGAPRGR